jgi:hypothetical protein
LDRGASGSQPNEAQETADYRVDSATSAIAGPMSGSADEIWQRARQTLTGLLADFADHGSASFTTGGSAGSSTSATGTAISAPNRLVVSFPAKYNSSKVACERPQNLAELEKAVQAAAGGPLGLELVVVADSEDVSPPRSTVSPRQQRAQTAEHPLVRQVTELFGAEVVRVDPGESST